MIAPPEIETPLPSELGGEKGERGRTSKAKPHRLAESIAVALKVHRARRWQCLAEGREVLTREGKRMKAAGETDELHLGDVFRTIDCMTKRIRAFVDLNQHPATGTASYAGLATCGSVWACPICASRIQERRREEIEQGIEAMRALGFVPLMVTLTFPHYAFHRLRDLIEQQAEAFKSLRCGKRWNALKSRVGFEGLIRSLEVTHGGNGWHPHTHELWFVRPGVDAFRLRAEITALWAAACRRAGLLDSSHIQDVPAFYAHSVDVRADVDSGDYLAKLDDSREWGIADEIAKAASKQGRASGVHPHALLMRKAPGDAALYVEFVKGMKGRRQLFWSHGLKARCRIEDVTDESIAESPEQGAELLAQLNAEAWRYVVGNDARCELLDAAEAAGIEGVAMLLRSLGAPESAMPRLPVREVAA